MAHGKMPKLSGKETVGTKTQAQLNWAFFVGKICHKISIITIARKLSENSKNFSKIYFFILII